MTDAAIVSAGTLLGTPLKVAEVRRETDRAVTIRFDVDDDPATRFAHRAGQFLTIQVPLPGAPVARCYSISSAPGHGVAVTVKAIDGGRASRWLLENARAGLELRALEPAGLFCPDDADRDVLLVGAGSGATPLRAILEWVLETGTGRITLVQSDRTRDDALFADRVDELAAARPERLRVIRRLTATEGRLDPDDVVRLAGDAEVFVCGPDGFTASVRDALRASGVPHARIRVEDFSSLEGDPFVLAAGDGDAETLPVEVAVDGVEHRLDWPTDRGLVDVMLDKGIAAPYSCREGECGSCMARLTSGEVELGTTDALEQEDIDDGYILACQARPLNGPLRVEF